jgi:AraC-like DNA-binding protein
MSPATFHRQFKSVTSMTPLQYQKQLRLLEARRLMIASNANVETAAFQVGYESSSQFSREYTRMFGKPPRRDISALRKAAQREDLRPLRSPSHFGSTLRAANSQS